MLNFTKVGDVLPSRRDLLKFGGAGLLGASAHTIWSGKASAADWVQKQPRGTAKNVIFVEISGAISHIDTFDFKENIATRKDFDVRKMSNGIYLPNALFPRFQKVLDKVAIMRTFYSHEEVHLNGEYYLQAGRPLNVAFAREIPSVGTVVSYELEKQRKETDTFPTYIAFNLEANQLGGMSTGFLPPKHSVFDLNPEQAVKGMSLDQKATELLEERYRLLTQIRDTQRSRMSMFGRTIGAFEDFSETGKRLLTDARWPAVFKITEEERKRYGNTDFGLSCLFSRNLLQQEGGTRYIHICHFGWDHHKQIWDRSIEDNHYKLISEFDPAAASLIEDLAATPSKTNPGKTLLDETLVVLMSEFGRTVGALNHMGGRDHHKYAFPALFAGAGVKGGLVLGTTDADGSRVVDTGWKNKAQPRIENVVATMYSALGIDWGKELKDTPSKRTYRYVDPFSADIIPTDELAPIFG
jgi:hypothetical protein